MTDIASNLESILFAAGDPVSIDRISLVLGVTVEEIVSACDELSAELINSNHGIRVVKFDNKLQLCSDSSKAGIITKTLETRNPPMLSNPALETLAIIAYFQPITLAYISKIRGVDSSYTVSSLSDKGLIEEKDRLEAPGRPILYGTTDSFLRTMGIEALTDLPSLPEMSSNNAIEELKSKIESLNESNLETENDSIENTEVSNTENYSLGGSVS